MVNKEVQQGCILSLLLVNKHCISIIKKVLHNWEDDVAINDKKLNLRYANNTVLLRQFTSGSAELEQIIENLKTEMSICVNRLTILGRCEIVNHYTYLSILFLIINDDFCSFHSGDELKLQKAL